jgi:hypothetical protein
MNPMAWKARLQRVANRFGYQIERVRPTRGEPFADQQAILQRCGVEVRRVFDLGAHIGATVRQYRALFPSAKIYAFEPFPQSFQSLSRLAAGDARIEACNVAVSDSDGTAVLRSYRHEQANSLLPAAEAVGAYYDRK